MMGFGFSLGGCLVHKWVSESLRVSGCCFGLQGSGFRVWGSRFKACFKFKTIHDEHQDDTSWQLLAQGSES